ncbi:general secretion pathway protein F [Thiothrix eikelboomii]|uniref:General secretion pathway protein F n=1 Tax=Thiothrix eikelboomii TaxID=92487 RepID=A0A1T4VXJ3_9GAMM|nr:type II secretion system F family protein [Thiothrix eikelboomii]SKA69730.1 general secretion pathway protein F [Thiothrix eikelboomii]
MPVFEYQALSAAGTSQSGTMEASSEAQVLERIHTQGLLPLQVKLAGVASVSTELGAKKKSGWLTSKKVSQADIIAFTQQLSSMLNAGLPLDRALSIQLELIEQPGMSKLVRSLQEQVRSGVHFADALEASNQFSRFYVNMVRAGEASGSIDDALGRLVDYMLRAKELRGTVVSALIYPSILFVVAILSIIALLLFVVPQFSQMFEEMGAELPMITKLVMAAGEALKVYWWAVLGGFLFILLVLQYVFTNEQARLWLDRSMLRWPIVGDLVGKVEMARFSRSLGTLLHNGVPLLGSLQIVKNTMSNRVMAKSIGEAADSLKQGESLTRTLMSKRVFPAYALHMLRVGEETGQMEQLLHEVANIYDAEVRNAVRQMLSLLEPILILIMALAILVIIGAVLIPMISMADLVQ